MNTPEGSLTPAQFEILQLLWQSPDGLTIAELWDAIRTDRDVSRTTVLNLVDRLEKRNWLSREKHEGVFRYRVVVDQQVTEAKLADTFVSEFFNGSTSSFVLSLLGSNRISSADLKRLKALLEESQSKRSQRKGS
ncbi:MAG: BlaI/MecI/CopY family transcriptional regulator [Planctomycetales bacterium]|nr:BlaI/MecI/CopY family transcriptional regulator [Planctomycetales bacterium]